MVDVLILYIHFIDCALLVIVMVIFKLTSITFYNV
jgi:hypothetical protein